jgi:hypothetical protein
MSVGVKNLESRESDFTRKIVLFGIATLCVLFGVGLSIFISLVLLEPSAGKIVNILSSIILPVLVSSYVLHYYYKHYFVRKSNYKLINKDKKTVGCFRSSTF